MKKSEKASAESLDSADAEVSREEPNDVLCYYDQARKTYLTLNEKEEWYELSQANLKLHIRRHGYWANKWLANGLNEVEDKIWTINHKFGVHYAGPVAGFTSGIYNVAGDRVLVTRGPKLVAPKRGKWTTIRKLFAELFEEQGIYFYAWLKHARDSMLAGSPFRPGQALAIAGKAGSGKSLTQSIITEILGGRWACPYRAMMGKTEFNSDLIKSEHLMIEDKVAGKDQRSRLEFAAALKSFVANKGQSNHKKTVDANMLTPFWRLTITLNDQPENMLVLPSLTEDIADKVMLLKAEPATMPYGKNDLAGYLKFWKDILAEIPALLFHLDRWEIPEAIQDVRYGVVAFHHPSLVENLRSLAPEQKLWEYICGSTVLFPGNITMWTGTAAELKAKLIESYAAVDVERLLSWPTATGVYLSRLESQMPKHVISHKNSGKITTYDLIKP